MHFNQIIIKVHHIPSGTGTSLSKVSLYKSSISHCTGQHCGLMNNGTVKMVPSTAVLYHTVEVGGGNNESNRAIGSPHSGVCVRVCVCLCVKVYMCMSACS